MRHYKILAASVAAAISLTSLANAQRVSVEIGDRPYFTHGPRYVERGYEYVWAPGHWADHRSRWIHGHYVRSARHSERVERRPEWLRQHGDRNSESHGYEDRRNSGERY